MLLCFAEVFVGTVLISKRERACFFETAPLFTHSLLPMEQTLVYSKLRFLPHRCIFVDRCRQHTVREIFDKNQCTCHGDT